MRNIIHDRHEIPIVRIDIRLIPRPSIVIVNCQRVRENGCSVFRCDVFQARFLSMLLHFPPVSFSAVDRASSKRMVGVEEANLSVIE